MAENRWFSVENDAGAAKMGYGGQKWVQVSKRSAGVLKMGPKSGKMGPGSGNRLW